MFREFIESIDFDLLQKSDLRRTVFCEFIESIDFDLLQNSDK